MKWQDAIGVFALCLFNGAVWGLVTGSVKVGGAVALTTVAVLALNDFRRKP